MRHERAWMLLPDLLDDRDRPGLMAHVSACHDCQRQLFRLERVDRLLRTASAERDAAAAARRRAARTAIALAVALAAAAASVLVAASANRSEGRSLTLRSASGRTVGSARLTRADRNNLSVLLVTVGLPVRRGDAYVLWAQGTSAAPRVVGRFMVSPSGSCRARFNLPAGRGWRRLWITPPDRPETLVATT